MRASANARHFTASFWVMSTALAAGKRDVVARIRVMVRECMRASGEALRCQHGEKTLRMRDTGDGDRRWVAQQPGVERTRRVGDAAPRLRHLRHRVLRPVGRRARAAQPDDGIDRCKPRRRFSQRSGRQQTAVTERAIAVDDRDLDIARVSLDMMFFLTITLYSNPSILSVF
jgi:hypothetical protein